MTNGFKISDVLIDENHSIKINFSDIFYSIFKNEFRADEQRKATEQLVSPDPDVTCIERSLEQDEYICLACDGIFDVLSNDDLASYISSRLKITDDYEKISSDVINTCLHKVKIKKF